MYEQVLKKNEQVRGGCGRRAREAREGQSWELLLHEAVVGGRRPLSRQATACGLTRSPPPSPPLFTAQVYALLAAATALCPAAQRLLDEAVANALREK